MEPSHHFMNKVSTTNALPVGTNGTNGTNGRPSGTYLYFDQKLNSSRYKYIKSAVKKIHFISNCVSEQWWNRVVSGAGGVTHTN